MEQNKNINVWSNMQIENRKLRTVLVDYLETIKDDRNIKEELVKALVDRAMTGDIKAFEMIAKFAGEFPNKRQFTTTDDEINADRLNLSTVIRKFNHEL
jgi:hypothetical protein